MPRQGQKKQSSEQGGIAGQILSLSVFIMMLAFFIVLNAISNYEEAKTKPIVQNVAMTFSNKIYQEMEEKPSVTQSVQKAAGEGDTFEQIDGLFRSQIASADIVASRQRGIIAIKMKRDDLDRAIDGLGTSGSAPFLATLASVLRSEKRRTPYKMEMTFYTEENPARLQNVDPEAMQKEINVVAGFAERLEKAGLPAKLISVGLEKGKADQVEIYFRRHIPFNPTGTEVEDQDG